MGYTRVIKTADLLFVRFENIGNRSKFDLLMDNFNANFPFKSWDEKRRAWALPPQELDRLIEFSNEVFGPNRFVVDRSLPRSKLRVNNSSRQNPKSTGL